MNRLESFMNTMEKLLGTRKKRHIAGGILLSTALLFGGLALTVMSLKAEEDNADDYEEIEEEGMDEYYDYEK